MTHPRELICCKGLECALDTTPEKTSWRAILVMIGMFEMSKRPGQIDTRTLKKENQATQHTISKYVGPKKFNC